MYSHYRLARNAIGTVEWADGHNPKVIGYFAEVGHSWVKDDETAWCAAFVGAMLERAGIASTRKLNARSYLDWGVPVALKDAVPGDIAVFSRGDPRGWQGHVSFFVKDNGSTLTVLGGNQRNRVGEDAYPKAQLLGIRRPKNMVPEVVEPTPPVRGTWDTLIASIAALFRRA